MRPPRLADVAALAQVSEATVSRVLNDKPGVATSTRQAVLKAVDLLGYDRPAKLRQRNAPLIGLVLPELTNPVFPAFAQAIESNLVRHGYTAVLCTQIPGGIHEDQYVHMLLERGVSGIIYISGQHADTTTEPDRYLTLREQGLPIVPINGYVKGIDAPFISTDDAAAVEMSIAHLADLGHSRIGLAVGPPRYTPVLRKMLGFRQGMASRVGVNGVEELIEHAFFTVEGGQAAAAVLVDRGCTALICGSDMMALGAIREVRLRGRKVPRDVSVIGYDDSPLIEFTNPPLTTVRQNVAAMSEAAVRALVDEIAGTPATRAEYVFRPELVVRGSTGVARDSRVVSA